MDQKFIQAQQFFGPTISLDQKVFSPNIFCVQQINWRNEPKVSIPRVHSGHLSTTFADSNIFFLPNICLGQGDFHWRRGIRPFQAENFRLKSCFFNFSSIGYFYHRRSAKIKKNKGKLKGAQKMKGWAPFQTPKRFLGVRPIFQFPIHQIPTL